MNQHQFRIAVENSDTFKKFPIFKQKLTLKRLNLSRLHDLYGQASRLGIDYLKQNVNLSSVDVALIADIL